MKFLPDSNKIQRINSRYKIRRLWKETNSCGKETEKRRIVLGFALAFAAVFLIHFALLLAAVSLFSFTTRPSRIAEDLWVGFVANVGVYWFMSDFGLSMCVKLWRYFFGDGKIVEDWI